MMESFFFHLSKTQDPGIVLSISFTLNQPNATSSVKKSKLVCRTTWQYKFWVAQLSKALESQR
jgi:hypothetical protein